MPYEFIGGGMDKDFYSESRSGGYGVICCSKEVALREIRAYVKLNDLELGGIIPIIKPFSEKEFSPINGLRRPGNKPQYKMEYIPNIGSFKPKMQTIEVSKKVRLALDNGDPHCLHRDIIIIQNNLTEICGVVGELTFVVRTNGGLHILDFGSTGSGTALSALDIIEKGILKIREYIESKVKNVSASSSAEASSSSSASSSTKASTVTEK